MATLRVVLAFLHALGLILWVMIGFQTPALAQVTTTITPDGSLGTAIHRNGSVFTIDGGTVRGPNLFHSFDRFDVGTDDIANFTGPDAVANILGRVTGGQLSMIDGTLQSDIAGADLFLLNPSGIMFGPNARLDIDGAFYVSTADVLELGDEGRFVANRSESSALSVATPSAFGFLGTGGGGLAVDGSALGVPEREMMSLIGGDIEIRGGTLAAPSGRVNLVSIASAGEVLLSPADAALPLRVDALATLGTIDISQGAQIDANGNGGGTVSIRSDRLQVDNSVISASTLGDQDGAAMGIDIQIAGVLEVQNGAKITSDTFGTGRGGDVLVSADRIVMSGGLTTLGDDTGGGFGPGTLAALTVVGTIAFNVGAGGDVTVKAGEFDMQGRADGAGILGVTLGPGQGGDVLVEATTLTISGTGTASGLTGIDTLAFPGSSGDAGDVTVRAVNFEMNNSSGVAAGTFGAGQAGDVLVEADRLVIADSGAEGQTGISSQASTGSSGDAGDVIVRARDLEIRSEGDGRVGISAGTFSTGRGGNVLVESDHLRLLGGDTVGSSGIGVETGGIDGGTAGSVTVRVGFLEILGGNGDTGIGARTRGMRSADAGDVIVTADRILIQGNGTGPTGIFTQALADSRGDAGDLNITAKQITIRDGAFILANTEGQGQGGSIAIMADEIEVSGGLIAAQSMSTQANAGRSGDITIRAGNTFMLRDNASINVQTARADAGSIALRSGTDLMIRGRSSITTSVADGQGNGGNIALQGTDATTLAQFVVLDESQIVANAKQGDGGNIQIASEVFLASPQSLVSASSELGNPGEVDVTALIADLSGVITPLTPQFTQAAALLRNRCATRQPQRKSSRFLVRSRDRLPIEPNGMLPSAASPPRLSATPSTAQAVGPQRRQPSAPMLAFAALPGDCRN